MRRSSSQDFSSPCLSRPLTYFPHSCVNSCVKAMLLCQPGSGGDCDLVMELHQVNALRGSRRGEEGAHGGGGDEVDGREGTWRGRSG